MAARSGPAGGGPAAGVRGTVFHWGLTTEGRVTEEPSLQAVPLRSLCCAGEWAAVVDARGGLTVLEGVREEPMPEGAFDLAAEVGAAQLAVGGAHFALLTDDGSMYSWGAAKQGQLGVNKSLVGDEAFEPEYVERLGREDGTVACIAAGHSHTAAVAGNGDLFTWGRDAEGQGGHGFKSARARDLTPNGGTGVNFAPRCVVYFVTHHMTVAKVACGHNFTAAITSDRAIYSWGSGGCGELGTGRVTQRDRPELVIARGADGTGFADIACGWGHTLALTLGEDPAEAAAASDSDDRTRAEGKGADGDGGDDAVAVTAGEADAASGAPRQPLPPRVGQIYVWGFNGKGQLGLGDTQSRHFPQLLAKQDLSASKQHVAAMAERRKLVEKSMSATGEAGASASMLPPHLRGLLTAVPEVDDGDATAGGGAAAIHIGAGLSASESAPLLGVADPDSQVLARGSGRAGTLGASASAAVLPPLKEQAAQRGVVRSRTAATLKLGGGMGGGSLVDIFGAVTKGAAQAKPAAVPLILPYRTPVWGPGDAPEQAVARATAIAVGEMHSAYCGPQGELYTWGCTASHRTGHPDVYDDMVNGDVVTPVLMNLLYPARMTPVGKRKVVAVACAKTHMVAVAKITFDALAPVNGYASGGTRLSLFGGGLEALAAPAGVAGDPGSEVAGVRVVFVRAKQAMPDGFDEVDDEEPDEDEEDDPEGDAAFAEAMAALAIEVPALCPFAGDEGGIQCVSPAFPSPCDVAVYVTVDGEPLEGVAHYSFYNPPEITAVTPAVIPLPVPAFDAAAAATVTPAAVAGGKAAISLGASASHGHSGASDSAGAGGGHDVHAGQLSIRGIGLYGCMVADASPEVRALAEALADEINTLVDLGKDPLLAVKKQRVAYEAKLKAATKAATAKAKKARDALEKRALAAATAKAKAKHKAAGGKGKLVVPAVPKPPMPPVVVTDADVGMAQPPERATFGNREAERRRTPAGGVGDAGAPRGGAEAASVDGGGAYGDDDEDVAHVVGDEGGAAASDRDSKGGRDGGAAGAGGGDGAEAADPKLECKLTVRVTILCDGEVVGAPTVVPGWYECMFAEKSAAERAAETEAADANDEELPTFMEPGEDGILTADVHAYLPPTPASVVDAVVAAQQRGEPAHVQVQAEIAVNGIDYIPGRLVEALVPRFSGISPDCGPVTPDYARAKPRADGGAAVRSTPLTADGGGDGVSTVLSVHGSGFLTGAEAAGAALRITGSPGQEWVVPATVISPTLLRAVLPAMELPIVPDDSDDGGDAAGGDGGDGDDGTSGGDDGGAAEQAAAAAAVVASEDGFAVAVQPPAADPVFGTEGAGDSSTPPTVGNGWYAVAVRFTAGGRFYDCEAFYRGYAGALGGIDVPMCPEAGGQPALLHPPRSLRRFLFDAPGISVRVWNECFDATVGAVYDDERNGIAFTIPAFEPRLDLPQLGGGGDGGAEGEAGGDAPADIEGGDGEVDGGKAGEGDGEGDDAAAGDKTKSDAVAADEGAEAGAAEGGEGDGKGDDDATDADADIGDGGAGADAVGDADADADADAEEARAEAMRTVNRTVFVSATLNGQAWFNSADYDDIPAAGDDAEDEDDEGESSAGGTRLYDITSDVVFRYYDAAAVGVVSVEPCKKVKPGTAITVRGVGWGPLAELGLPITVRLLNAEDVNCTLTGVPTVVAKAGGEDADGEAAGDDGADGDAAAAGDAGAGADAGKEYEVVVTLPEMDKKVKGSDTGVEVSVDGGNSFSQDGITIEIKG